MAASKTSFVVEDLTLDIPTDHSGNAKTLVNRFIKRSASSQHVQKSSSYEINQTANNTLRQFSEMCRNPYFSTVPIYELDKRINTGLITGLNRKWQFNISNLSVNFIKGYGKFLFLQDTIERSLHDRWKILIREDFDTDAAWPTNGALVGSTTPGNSLGDVDQIQDIPWIEESGTWSTSTTAGRFISGTQSLECDVAGYVSAGWNWWENYVVECWVYRDDSAGDLAGILFRYTDTTNRYLFTISSATQVALTDNIGTIMIASFTTLVDIWYHLKVEVQGHRIKCYINGDLVIDKISTTQVAGKAGVYASANNTHFDNFKVILLPPTNFNLAASTDWTNQYSHADISTAHGTQKKLIAPDNNVQFKQSRAGEDCVLYLPMNEGQGTPKDHSKNQSTVIMKGPTWIEDSEKGWCLEFDGVDDSGYVNIDGLLDSSSYVTVDFDLYIPSGSSSAIGILALERINADRFTWAHDRDAGLFGWWDNIDGNGTYVRNNTHIYDQWYRVTTIFNDTIFMAFLNGQLLKIYENDNGDSVEDIDVDYFSFGTPYIGSTNFGAMRVKNLRVFDAS